MGYGTDSCKNEPCGGCPGYFTNPTIKVRIGEGNQRWWAWFFLPERRLQRGTLNRKPTLELSSKQRGVPLVRILHARSLENRYLLLPKYSAVQSKQHSAAWESGSAWVVACGRSRSGGSAILMM